MQIDNSIYIMPEHFAKSNIYQCTWYKNAPSLKLYLLAYVLTNLQFMNICMDAYLNRSLMCPLKRGFAVINPFILVFRCIFSEINVQVYIN